MTSFVLAVDLGSTGIKVAVVDAGGAVRGVAGEVLPLRFVDGGGVEQDPRCWWDALGRCARRAVAESGVSGSEVGLVAVTSQYTSTTAVDTAGRPLGNTVMWMDGRGQHHRRKRPDPADAATFAEVHGLVPSGNDDVAHVDLIRALWPDVYEAAHAFVEPMDLLAARLTGRVTATQNTMFPMMTCDNRTWGLTSYDEQLLALTGMPPDKLPELVPLGAPRGTVTAEAALHLGVAAGAVVTGATIDSVTTAVGTGAVSSDRCGLVIGTTAVMATHLPSKRHDLQHGLTAAPSALPHSWFLVAENGIGGKALEVFVRSMVYAADGLGLAEHDASFADVLSAAASSPCGSNGVLFAPWLVGSMAPGHDRLQRGGFVNIGLGTTRADLARAVLEGVAMNVAWLLPYFSRLAGHSYDEVVFGGGGAASPLWGQILADAMGVPVRRLTRSSCTNAHGAALLALAEQGVIGFDDMPSCLVTDQVHDPDPASQRVLAARTGSLVELHRHLSSFYEAFDMFEHPGADLSPNLTPISKEVSP